MAAAVGAGMPVHEARGSMVLDIGGGTSEVAVISLNGIVYAASVRIGGDRFDEAIIELRAPQLRHPDRRSDRRAHQDRDRLGLSRPAGARDLGEGPQPLRRRAAQLHAELATRSSRPCRSRCRASSARSRRRSSRRRPELGADVAERGIVLTGGGALLRDIDKLLMEETGLPVVVAEDPLTCVARGGGRMLELIDEHGPGLFGLE